MNKVKFLTITSIVLLLLNLGFVGFIFFGPHVRYQQGPKIHIIKKLGLDAAQIEAYEVIIKTHQNKVKEINDKIVALKKELYQCLSDESKKTSKDSIVNELGELQKEMELAHLGHFSELKTICKADQLGEFDSLVLELEELFSTKIRHPKKK